MFLRKKKNTCASDGEGWMYTQTVKDHFFTPRNILFDETGYEADGTGKVGSPECGDAMIVWIKVDKETGRIKGIPFPLLLP